MENRRTLILLFTCIYFFICFRPIYLQAQPRLWFGTVKAEGRISQARFEIDSFPRNIIYAPYGRTPIRYTAIKTAGEQLTFNWLYNTFRYHCTLLKQAGIEYKGTCTASNDKAPAIELVMRDFTPEDADLQGNSLKASTTDLRILDRALALLNNGSNWSRSDNRVCDNSSYPYKWSLFCALHQASIDVDSEYRHLRPAIHAAREAINEAAKGKQFAHMLQDFNKETQSFEVIASVLNRAKEIITARMKNEK